MRKGFTLIELIIVVGILAILGTGVVLVLNPGEKLREARDTQRIADLRTVKDAVNFYRVRYSQPSLNLSPLCTSENTTYPQWRASISNLSNLLQPFKSSGSLNGVQNSVTYAAPEDARKIDGSGWVAVNFDQLNSLGGSPIAKLPLDPRNFSPAGAASLAGPILGLEAAYFYAYQCFGLRFEINANMESNRYGSGGQRDVESVDGGRVGRFRGVYDPLDPACTPGATSGCTFHSLLPGVPYSTSFIADQMYELGDIPGFEL